MLADYAWLAVGVLIGVEVRALCRLVKLLHTD
jgi:hypothetical protein